MTASTALCVQHIITSLGQGLARRFWRAKRRRFQSASDSLVAQCGTSAWRRCKPAAAACLQGKQDPRCACGYCAAGMNMCVASGPALCAWFARRHPVVASGAPPPSAAASVPPNQSRSRAPPVSLRGRSQCGILGRFPVVVCVCSYFEQIAKPSSVVSEPCCCARMHIKCHFSATLLGQELSDTSPPLSHYVALSGIASGSLLRRDACHHTSLGPAEILGDGTNRWRAATLSALGLSTRLTPSYT